MIDFAFTVEGNDVESCLVVVWIGNGILALRRDDCDVVVSGDCADEKLCLRNLPVEYVRKKNIIKNSELGQIIENPVFSICNRHPRYLRFFSLNSSIQIIKHLLHE